jgi:phage antirepressor YoqD-like protein
MNQNFSTYLKKTNLRKVIKPKVPFCENLIAEEGSILFCSKQIKQDKPNELPINIVVFATTSQILYKSDGLSAIKVRRRYPDRILPL